MKGSLLRIVFFQCCLLFTTILAFKSGLKANHAFNVKYRQPNSPGRISSKTQLSSHWVDLSSSYVSVVADYAAEIENSVGTEIYGPIFKAGIFIFCSGFISCFIAAFIVSKSDAWEGIELEFQAGKEAQLIDMGEAPSGSEVTTVDTTATLAATTVASAAEEQSNKPVVTESTVAEKEDESFADLDI